MAFWPPFAAAIFMRLRTSSRWSNEPLSVTNGRGQGGENGSWLGNGDVEGERRTIPVAPLDSGREAVENRRAPRPEEKPMDDLAIRRRVEHTIEICRAFDIEPDARTVAEIMCDEDTGGAVYEERALAFEEYEKVAARALHRLRVASRSA